MDRKKAIKRATELVEKMTIEEMASQLKFDAPAIERLGIPEYNWWNEGLHGVARAGTATVFPQAIGLGATFDEELLNKVGRAVAVEARAKYNEASKQEDRDIYKGLTMWSPNVNIFRDPRWGRGHETYGEDPYLSGKLGVSFIEGLQGEDEYMLTAACAKHFAVHSGPEEMRHFFDAKVSTKDLWETYLPAFEMCVKDGSVEAVMGAYNRTNGDPCCAHPMLMNEILRGKWEFIGHYVSDCWAIRDFHERHKITSRPEESVKMALEMGCDLNCGCTYERVVSAYKEGLIKEETIKKSAIRLFTTRMLLGMFDETKFDHISYEKVECKEHLELAERAACESIVMLKNDGIMPLNREKVKKIGVIGPNANSRRALIGNYYGTSSKYITVLDGILDEAGDDIRVLYSEGCHLYKNRKEDLARPDDRLSEAVTIANHSDLVVLCLGLDETLEGEEGDTGNSDASGDKIDLQFPDSQLRLLEAIVRTKVPFILCVMAGSAMDLCYSAEHANGILQAWYPGGRGGRQIAEILFGKQQPSGKLPITIYKDLEGMAEFTDYSMKGRTYKYIEKAPLYPFGYGLTYGELKINQVKMVNKVSYMEATKEGAALQISVSNDTDIDTHEVLQIYVKVTESKNEVLHHKLGSFKRITVKSGHKKDVLMNIPARMFYTINENGEQCADGKNAIIYIGFGQPDERTKELLNRECSQIII